MNSLRDTIERFLQEKYGDTSIRVLEFRINSERFTVRTTNNEDYAYNHNGISNKNSSIVEICYEFSRKQFEKFERKEKISKLYE